MSYAKLFKVSAILGIALYITFIVTGMLLAAVMPFVPLSFLGTLGSLVYMVIQIVAMGLVGAVVLKYIH